MSKTLQKILYVEDEEDIRAIAALSLQDLGGYTVKFCENGKKALLEAEAFAPDLIILDVMMPELDGPSTLIGLQKIPALKSVPAIFMTARVQESEVEEYKKLGAIEVIAKPFDPMTLSDQIKKIWDKYHGQ